MREHAKIPENGSRTIDNTANTSRQASANEILQAYKDRFSGNQLVQRESIEEEDILQGKFDVVQQEEQEEDELLQGKFESAPQIEQEPTQREEKTNNTGLPDNLKAGIESLSGYSMDDVKVYYSSGKPAQLNALAYAQGTDIHVAPGQEKHLPHEAWHVVQQKQGRVKPTVQLQGISVNDNEELEKEAEQMGRISSQKISKSYKAEDPNYTIKRDTILQRTIMINDEYISSLSELEYFVVDFTSFKQKISENGVDEKQINNAIRSLELILVSNRESVKTNTRILEKEIKEEIKNNTLCKDSAKNSLDFIDDEKVVSYLVLNIGEKEVLRLGDIIKIIWEKGNPVSLTKLVEILQTPQIINESICNQFKEFLSKHSSVHLKFLFSKPIRDIQQIVSDGQIESDFLSDEELFENTGSEFSIDPLKIVEIEPEDRFLKKDNRNEGLNYDLKIVKDDQDYNIQEDMEYIARLESKYNKTLPDEEPLSNYKYLESELIRMKKIYRHKINYVSVRQEWKKMIHSEEDEINQLRRISNQKLTQMKQEYEKITIPPLRKSRRGQGDAGYNKNRCDIRNKKIFLSLAIEQYKRKLEVNVKEIKNKWENEREKLKKKTIDFFKVDERYFNLIISGIMLLPSDMRLAGIFPREFSVNIKGDSKNIRYETLYKHARNLILNHGLYYEGKSLEQNKSIKGILPSARKGCVCIMYVKVGKMKNAEGASYRPFFGASGIDPFGRDTNTPDLEVNSYIYMGLPIPEKSDSEQTKLNLSQHLEKTASLGIKQPAIQSQLYFLQTANDSEVLENWIPSNCAEPAIMTAIFQLYDQPRDIILSVPFEGELYKGKLLLKYTCKRCAVAEPAFWSPIKEKDKRLTDMRLKDEASSLYPEEQLDQGDLVHNEDNKSNPYSEKITKIKNTIAKNRLDGFKHTKIKTLVEGDLQSPPAGHKDL